MNRPSKNDDGNDHPGWNQNPPSLSADLTTRSDLNGIANSRSYRSHRLRDSDSDDIEDELVEHALPRLKDGDNGRSTSVAAGTRIDQPCQQTEIQMAQLSADGAVEEDDVASVDSQDVCKPVKGIAGRTAGVLVKYAKFIGPGAMVSVAYIDPGNYATDISAGATYRFKLLFIILLSNIFAIFLQSLCVKLGSVTGMNLAQMCKAHTPRWLNYTLYAFAEAAIIATDIAEVIGTAIALNLLFHLPLVAGCAISIVDVLVFLLFYRPSGSIRGLRIFELFVMALVLGVVICFCFQLSLIKDTSVGEVFRGYLPSSAIVQSKGLYQSCGILGATVMPHSLYLGSGMVQPRLLEYDQRYNNVTTPPPTPSNTTILNRIKEASSASDTIESYKPSLAAIKSCMSYSIAELAISLFTFALFVNSAILIVAGASLSNPSSDSSNGAASGDLFQVHSLLSSQLSPAAGVLFALALLLSGTSAGIVCTIAGQMVSEGQLSLQLKPWIRRLMTRSIAITPAIIIAGAVGQEGLSTALEATQVALSVILPFVSAPLIYFTCRAKFMGVVDADPQVSTEPNAPSATTTARGEYCTRTATMQTTGTVDSVEEQQQPQPERANSETAVSEREGVIENAVPPPRVVQMRNHWTTIIFAILIWTIIVIMNVAALVLLGLGVE